MAARFGNVDAVALLLERGADFDASANDHSTPRSIAIRYQRSDILQTYFDWRASPVASVLDQSH
jgi:ankyrin repeat protein